MVKLRLEDELRHLDAERFGKFDLSLVWQGERHLLSRISEPDKFMREVLGHIAKLFLDGLSRLVVNFVPEGIGLKLSLEEVCELLSSGVKPPRTDWLRTPAQSIAKDCHAVESYVHDQSHVSAFLEHR